LLNKSQLIIVYGPKTSGKSTTVNQVLKGRKGVIRVSYQKETNLIKELGRIEIPNDKRSLNMVETIFQEFKKVYGSYPIIVLISMDNMIFQWNNGSEMEDI
jgi:AAA+ ATPase superfamily predicted ATPase